MRLEGKRVLITGGGSGIGRALARTCADKGARVVLNGRRVAALEETRGLLPLDSEVMLVPADISNTSGRREICRAIAAGGALDVLVNNAGQVPAGRLEDHSDSVLEQLFATNVVAPLALTRDLLPQLRAAEAPRVVNVGSIFGDIGHPMFAAYSASKFALRGFSDAMRRELALEGIGVTYVAPRAARTAATAAFAELVRPFDMRMDAPETVAAQIVSAIEREAATAYALGPERFFVLVQRLLPRLVDRALIGKQRKLVRSLEAREAV